MLLLTVFRGFAKLAGRFVICQVPLAYLALNFLEVIFVHFETIPDAWLIQQLTSEFVSLSQEVRLGVTKVGLSLSVNVFV